jgi:hypothetical protein
MSSRGDKYRAGIRQTPRVISAKGAISMLARGSRARNVVAMSTKR